MKEDMGDMAGLRAVVYGHVQGVYYRDFACRHAIELGLTGYTRNMSGIEAVEVVAEGERERLVRLLSHLKVGPPSADVNRVITDWTEYSNEYKDFRVIC